MVIGYHPSSRFSSATSSPTAGRAIPSVQSTRHNPTTMKAPRQSVESVHQAKIAIVGFGNFGQFLTKAFIRQGHIVYAHSWSNYRSIAESIGAAFFSDPLDLCEQHPDVMVICTSIISTESVLRSLPLQRLRQNTLFVDVLSVKEFSKNIFLKSCPLISIFSARIPCLDRRVARAVGKVCHLCLIRCGSGMKIRGWRGLRISWIFSRRKGVGWWR